MKIKMLTLQAGPNGVREAGKIYDVPGDEAKALIAGQYAIPAEKSAPAVEPVVEKIEAESLQTEEMPTDDVEKAIRRGKKDK